MTKKTKRTLSNDEIRKQLASTIKRYKYHEKERKRKEDIFKTSLIVNNTRNSSNQVDTLICMFEDVPKDSNIWNLVKKEVLLYNDIDDDVILWLKLQ